MVTLSLLLGLLVGCLVAATGIGGGILLTPVLIVVLHIPPVKAVGTALVFMSLTKVFAALHHWRQKTVDFRLASYLLLGSIPGALAGSEMLILLQARVGHEADFILQRGIGISLIFIAIISLIVDRLRDHRWLFTKGKDDIGGSLERKNAVVIGFVGGSLVSATSVGSGSLLLLLLIIFCRRSTTTLVGTDIFHGMLLTLIAALLHLRIGGIDSYLLARLLIGSVPGVVIGTYICILIRPFSLRTTLLVLSAVSGFVMTL